MTTPTQTTAVAAPIIPPPSRVLLTVRQLARQQPALSEGGIRWDLHNRASNGLAKSGAILQRGRRLLIDPEKYLAWLESRGEVAA
jgi:hypothetical protein